MAARIHSLFREPAVQPRADVRRDRRGRVAERRAFGADALARRARGFDEGGRAAALVLRRRSAPRRRFSCGRAFGRRPAGW
jgi:hypothetical protein